MKSSLVSKFLAWCLLLSTGLFVQALAFTTSPPPGYSLFLDNLLRPFTSAAAKNKEDNMLAQQRRDLKTKVLEICKSGGEDVTSLNEQRKQVEALFPQLKELNPTGRTTAASPLLNKKWILEWTTEKEINFFKDWNIAGDEIIQTIDENKILKNNIPFKKGGCLGVTGSVEVDLDVPERSNFIFTNAKLDLGSWGSFDIPPVGAGWFDTIYLDDDFRVDINSRNDILIVRC